MRLMNPGPMPRPDKPPARRWILARGRWLLILLILLTSCALALTLTLFIRAITVSAISPAASLDARPDALATVSLARAVIISDAGEERQHLTALDNPRDILDEAGVSLGAADKIWVNGALAFHEALPDWTVPARHISIRRAVTVTFIDDSQSSSIETSAKTVGDALAEAGIAIHAADRLDPPPDQLITGPITARIDRATPLVLSIDGVDIETRSTADTVAEVLAELDAPLYGLDYARPPGDSPVTADMLIEIVRVTEETVSETEIIEHQTQYRADEELYLDETALIQSGSDGQRRVSYRVRYENGREVSRVHSETVVLEAAVDRIVAYGTKAGALGSVQTPAGPRAYWRRLCVYISSYNPKSNGGNLNTATGATLAKGIVAAKPHIIPYYTQVFVPGYGIGSVRDTGGGPSGTDYWIDLGYGYDDGFKNWRKYDYVYLLGAPPAKTPAQLPAWTPASHYPGRCD